MAGCAAWVLLPAPPSCCVLFGSHSEVKAGDSCSGQPSILRSTPASRSGKSHEQQLLKQETEEKSSTGERYCAIRTLSSCHKPST